MRPSLKPTARGGEHSPRVVHYDGEWLATGYAEFGDYKSTSISGVRQLESGETVEAFLTIGVNAVERYALAGGPSASSSVSRGIIDPLLRESVSRRRCNNAGLDLSAL